MDRLEPDVDAGEDETATQVVITRIAVRRLVTRR